MSKAKSEPETEPRGHRLTAGEAATTIEETTDSDGHKIRRGKLAPGMARDYAVNSQTGKAERVRSRSGDGE